jgi:GTP cyclohydrolase I
MSALVTIDHRIPHHTSNDLLARHVMRPTRAEAEQAVNTLIRWAGDDPGRAGLIDPGPGRPSL